MDDVIFSESGMKFKKLSPAISDSSLTVKILRKEKKESQINSNKCETKRYHHLS